MQEGIFISYRREGGSTFSSILYSELCKFFAAENIFKDVNTLTPGSNFKKEIESALDKSSIVLLLIDKHWSQLQNDKGEKKIFSKNDFVRYEIAVALEKNLEIIPVLFENGGMPAEKELPLALRPLCSKHAFTIHVESVIKDVKLLIEYIRSKKKFLFDEKSFTGSYERLLKDPAGTIKKGWKQNAEIIKKDFNYLKGFLGKFKNKE
jgi:hypothetical protein